MNVDVWCRHNSHMFHLKDAKCRVEILGAFDKSRKYAADLCLLGFKPKFNLAARIRLNDLPVLINQRKPCRWDIAAALHVTVDNLMQQAVICRYVQSVVLPQNVLSSRTLLIVVLLVRHVCYLYKFLDCPCDLRSVTTSAAIQKSK
jgi:hypothetical protein